MLQVGVTSGNFSWRNRRRVQRSIMQYPTMHEITITHWVVAGTWLAATMQQLCLMNIDAFKNTQETFILFYLSQRVHTWLCPVKIDTTPALVVSADTYRPQLRSANTAPYWATPDNFSALWNHAAIIVIIIWVISDGNIVVQCRTMTIDSQTLWICAIAISTAKSHWLIDLNCI